VNKSGDVGKIRESALDEGQQGVEQENLTRENLRIEFCTRNFVGICP
jgi:hypothetical protein